MINYKWVWFNQSGCGSICASASELRQRRYKDSDDASRTLKVALCHWTATLALTSLESDSENCLSPESDSAEPISNPLANDDSPEAFGSEQFSRLKQFSESLSRLGLRLGSLSSGREISKQLSES